MALHPYDLALDGMKASPMGAETYEISDAPSPVLEPPEPA